MRQKYDGKLTDSLIQTVIEAERRTWAKPFGIGQADLLVDIQQTMTQIVTIAPPCGPKDAIDESVATNSTTGQPEAVAGHSLGGLGHEDDDRHDY